MKKTKEELKMEKRKIYRTGIEIIKKDKDKFVFRILKDNRILEEKEINGERWMSLDYLNKICDNGNLGLIELKKQQIRRLKQEIKKIKRGESFDEQVNTYFRYDY